MLKDFLNKKKLLFDHETPEDFVRCFWQKQPRVLLIWIIYRFAVLLYFTGGIITICVKPSPGFVCKKNMIYFAHWAYVSEIFAHIFACTSCVQRYVQEKKNPELPAMEKMPALYKVFWCFYAIATPCSFGITVMFWVFMYNPDQYETLFYTILSHVVNPLVIVTDFFISALPFRFLHVYWPILFAFLYIIFTIIYQFSGGTGNNGKIPIHSILDWRDPKIAASTCAVSLGSVIIMHGVTGVLYMVKQFLKTMKDRGIERDNALEDET